jgi:hypothetical protein
LRRSRGVDHDVDRTLTGRFGVLLMILITPADRPGQECTVEDVSP